MEGAVTVVAGDMEADIPEDCLEDTADSLVDIPEDSLDVDLRADFLDIVDSLAVKDLPLAIED